MDSTKSCMLKAAFTGDNDKLLKIIKQLYQDKLSGKQLDKSIMEYIKISASHINQEISSISCKIISNSQCNNNQNGHSEKRKRKPTQKVVDEIEIKLNECINNKIKLNESLIFSIIDFLYKSLESIKIGKPFEKITFNSKYMCIVFKSLYKCMNECLIDYKLINKKNNNNISLNNILKSVINKNITIS
eukprot:95897_1